MEKDPGSLYPRMQLSQSPELEHLTSSMHNSTTKFSTFGCVCRWSSIAAELPGRTDNEIKNYWKTHLRRKIYSFTKKIHDGSTYGGCQNW
ncbi:hypothetical protein SCA6_015723 [Theobroma cacao]